jgi:hypothetical protein
MEWRHEIELKDLHKASNAEISEEPLSFQERGAWNESHIRDAELKAGKGDMLNL